MEMLCGIPSVFQIYTFWIESPVKSTPDSGFYPAYSLKLESAFPLQEPTEITDFAIFLHPDISINISD